MNEIDLAVKETLVLAHSQTRISCSELQSRQAERAILLLNREGILRESRFGFYALTTEFVGRPLEDLLPKCEGRIKRSIVSLLLLFYWGVADFVFRLLTPW